MQSGRIWIRFDFSDHKKSYAEAERQGVVAADGGAVFTGGTEEPAPGGRERGFFGDCRRDSASWSSGPERCDRILDLGDRLSAVRREFGERLIPEAWDRDVLSLRGEALSLGQAWYRFLSRRWRSVRAEIAALGVAAPKDAHEMVAWCDAILAESRLRAELDSLQAE